MISSCEVITNAYYRLLSRVNILLGISFLFVEDVSVFEELSISNDTSIRYYSLFSAGGWMS